MPNQADLTNYDPIANTYIPHSEHPLSWNNLYERPYMLSVFDDFTCKQVLDLGSGTGFFAFHALKQGAAVTAVDASTKMLDHIKAQDVEQKLNLVCADLNEGLPFVPDNSQHYIVASLMLHYLENWEPLLAEMYRVLQPGGKVYISTHHPFAEFTLRGKESYLDKFFLRDEWGQNKTPFPVHFYTRPLNDLLRPFLQSLFNILNIEEPKPGEACKQAHPQLYQRLLQKPAFIFITLQK